MQKFNFTQKGTWSQFIAKLNGMFNQKADKTEIPAIPTALPNPQAITFSGILPEVSYDGTQAVNVALPTPEMIEESVGTPVGEIISFMGNTAPKNYLKCDGTVYNIADYPELAQHFVTEFGTSNHFGGDGETTFAVPDLQGEFLRGTGTNGHPDSGSGANVGVHQQGSFVPGLSSFLSSVNLDVYVPKQSLSASGVDKVKTLSGSLAYLRATGFTSGTPQLISIRPTNTSVLYCIKYKSEHFIQVGGVNYSLEERKIGTWIDGKPLYEKTINFGNLPNATTKEVPHGIENVDEIWVYDGYVKGASSSIQSVWSGSSWYNFYASKQHVICLTSSERDSIVGVVIVRYTKTTDGAVVS